MGSMVLIALASLFVVGLGAAVALYFGTRVKDSGDWLIAGRTLPLYVVVFTQFATAAGGGVLVAHVGIAYASGWSVFAYEAFVLAGFLILALIAKWLREQEFSTVPDILDPLFGENKTVKAIAALCTVVIPFGWLATQFVAFGKLFSEITGAPVTLLIAIVALVALVFVLPGGLLSVAWLDFVFGVITFVVSLGIAAYAYNMAGGWAGITAKVPEGTLQFPQGLGAAGTSTILLWLFAIVPGTLTNQLYFQRIFAQRDVSSVRRGLVISGLVTFAGAGIYAFVVGVSVRAVNPGFSAAESELAAGWFLAQLPVWVLVVYSALIVATVLDTTASALQSVVTNLVRDLYQGILSGRRNERQLVSLSRTLTVVVTIIAGLSATIYPQALDWLVATYAYSASALAAPIFLGYALRNSAMLVPAVAIAGMVGGILGAAVTHVMGTAIPYAVYGIVASAVCMLVAGLIAGRSRLRQESSAG